MLHIPELYTPATYRISEDGSFVVVDERAAEKVDDKRLCVVVTAKWESLRIMCIRVLYCNLIRATAAIKMQTEM